MWIQVRPVLFAIGFAIAVSGGAEAQSSSGSGVIVGTGPGVGVYTLNRIVVNRTYSTGAGFTLPGTIKAGTQTLPPGTISFELGWDYFFPDAAAGPYENKFIVTYDINLPNTLVPCDLCTTFLPGSSRGYFNASSNLTGQWNSSGYGQGRDHTFSISGYAGSNSFSYCCNPDVTGSQSIGTDPLVVAPPALSPAALSGAEPGLNIGDNEITLTVYGMMDFGDQGTGMMQIDYVYTPGAAACPFSSYSLKLPTQFPDASGGSFTVGVNAPPGCAWSSIVQSGVGFPSVPGLTMQNANAFTGFSGLGNGEVVFMETPNLGNEYPTDGPVYRGWVVNIAGQLLAITQPPGSGSGGPYRLNHIDVTRTYQNGVGLPATNPIGALTQSFPANHLVLAYQAGWDFFWGNPTPTIYRNRFVSLLNLELVPASVTPGAQPIYVSNNPLEAAAGYVPFVDMRGDWVASGYGVSRTHTLATTGAAGAVVPPPGFDTGVPQPAPCQSPSDDPPNSPPNNPDGNDDLGCANDNYSTVLTPQPPPIPQPDNNNEVHLVVNGTMNFGYDAGLATVAVDLVYTMGSGLSHVRDWQGNGQSGALLYDPVGGQSYTAVSNGNGTYNYVPNLFTPGFNILRSGDFNGDGKSDLVVYNSHTALAYIGFGNGDGTFNFQSLFWSSGYDTVETGDINGDGKTDVALYNSSTGTLYTGISNGTGAFSYQYHLVSPNFTFVRLADFTGDANADLFLYNTNTGQAALGVGDGAGNFTFNPLFISPGYALADIGDLNGDGKMDVILYNPGNGNAATGISNGAGGFAFTPLIFSPGFTSVRLADYTGDGLTDVTVYNKNNAAAYFGTGTGTGTFSFQSLFWSPGYDYVEPEDVNGDGKMDVVLYGSTTGTEYTGISNGNGTFSYTYQYWGIGRVLAR